MRNGYEVVLTGAPSATLTRAEAREWAEAMRIRIGWPVGGRIAVRPAPKRRKAKGGGRA